MKAKTSYCRRHTELIVKRLKAERKELDIRIKAELKAKQREVESSLKVAIKVSHIRLYSEVTEKVGQADLYTSNLLVFLEDLEVKAMAKRIKVTSKLNIKGKLNINWLNIVFKAVSTKLKLKVKDSL